MYIHVLSIIHTKRVQISISRRSTSSSLGPILFSSVWMLVHLHIFIKLYKSNRILIKNASNRFHICLCVCVTRTPLFLCPLPSSRTFSPARFWWCKSLPWRLYMVKNKSRAEALFYFFKPIPPCHWGRKRKSSLHVCLGCDLNISRFYYP